MCSRMLMDEHVGKWLRKHHLATCEVTNHFFRGDVASLPNAYLGRMKLDASWNAHLGGWLRISVLVEGKRVHCMLDIKWKFWVKFRSAITPIECKQTFVDQWLVVKPAGFCSRQTCGGCFLSLENLDDHGHAHMTPIGFVLNGHLSFPWGGGSLWKGWNTNWETTIRRTFQVSLTSALMIQLSRQHGFCFFYF